MTNGDHDFHEVSQEDFGEPKQEQLERSSGANKLLDVYGQMDGGKAAKKV